MELLSRTFSMGTQALCLSEGTCSVTTEWYRVCVLWGVVFCLSDRQTLTKPRVGGKVGNRHSQSQTLLKRLRVGTFPGSSLAILKYQDGKDPEIPLLGLPSSVVIGCMRG